MGLFKKVKKAIKKLGSSGVLAMIVQAVVMFIPGVNMAYLAVASMVAGRLINAAFSKKPKSKGGDSSDAPISSTDKLVSVRQPAAPWDIVYGEVRKGGTITYIETSADKQNLLMVITLAGHVSQEIEEVYFDEELVMDSANNIAARYAGYLLIVKSLGDEVGQPFADLVTYSAGSAAPWTDSCRQTGRTKIYLRLVKNADLFANGVPDISVLMKGKKVIDPRISPTAEAYANNGALCVNDYLINQQFGVACVYGTEINETQLVSAANTCDESVARAGSPSETEARYPVNGVFRTDSDPQTVIGWMLAAMAGKTLNVGGQWYIYAGAYEAPTITLDEDDFAGPIKVQSLLSRKDNANGVKGVFTDRANSWQTNDFPPVASDTYMQLDGGERYWRDIDLTSFVTSPSQAQRVAKIELLRMRQGLTVETTFKLTAYEAMTGKTIALTHAQFGWTAKAFDVASSKFAVDDDGAITIEMVLRETAAAVYDWATSEEQVQDLAPNTGFPDPFDDLDVTGVTATSGTADLFRQGDGTIVPRIRLRWSAPANPFLDHYEIQFARISESPTLWINTPKPTKAVTEAFVESVSDGVEYDLRIRAVTNIGNAGEFAYVYGHTVIGKTELPSDVTGASAVQTGGLVVMGCTSVEDTDLDLVEVRLQDEGDDSWANGSPIGNILRGQTVTSAAIPPGTWELLFKARDTTGNYSQNAARVTISVTSEGFTQISSTEQAPDWLGTLTHMVRHHTGVIVPESQNLAWELDFEVFDEFVPNPYPDCYYEAPEIDKGIDATARVYGDIVSVLGPGETTGIASPSLEIDVRLAAGAYDGFETWTVGSQEFRYMKSRIHVETAIGIPVISSFTPTMDALAHTEVLTDQAVDAAGTVWTFDHPFHVAPMVQVTNSGTPARLTGYEAKSATAVTLRTFDTSGVGASGTVDAQATGA